jgi:hypothetical protein
VGPSALLYQHQHQHQHQEQGKGQGQCLMPPVRWWFVPAMIELLLEPGGRMYFCSLFEEEDGQEEITKQPINTRNHKNSKLKLV